MKGMQRLKRNQLLLKLQEASAQHSLNTYMSSYIFALIKVIMFSFSSKR